MKTVMIRNVEVGTGAPKIVVPIVANTRETILDKARELEGLPLDVVEWRADYYEDILELKKVTDTLQALRAVLGATPILFTFRTRKEGGEKSMGMGAYSALNKAVAENGADAVDIEIFSGDKVVAENIRAVHAAGKVVVGSSHDFHRTPSCADLIYRMRKMQDMGADILKIAVMPQCKLDVLTLFSATEEMYRCFATQPLVTVSMSADGVISRLCGEVFGSAMTFGAVGATSAPGQIPLEQLNVTIRMIHETLYGK